MKKRKISDEDVSTEIMTITPAMASAWLEENKFDNRRLDDRNVDKIARDIKSNKWVFDGTPIRFDRNNNIIDGQHRLWAIVMTGKAVESSVVRGLEENAKYTIDCGKSRSNADIFHFHGYTNNTVLASVCRLAIGYRDSNKDMWKWAKDCSHKRLTTQELLKEAESNKKIHKSIDDTFNLKVVGKMFGKSTAAFCHYVISLAEAETWKVSEFFVALDKGVNLPEDSPILTLRNTLTIRDIDMQDSKGGNKACAYKTALVIKCWNAWRDGRVINRLMYRPEADVYPVPK